LLPELRALLQLNPGINVALADGLASWYALPPAGSKTVKGEPDCRMISNRMRDVNLLHDPFRQADCVRNERLAPWSGAVIVQVFRVFQVSRHENRCRDQYDALAAFVHEPAV
jgi:hypothetical protein